MEIVSVSITDYLNTCINAAYKRGFLWVMVFLARERDATHSYQELDKYWESFNDLTSSSILFVLSAKNKKTSPLLNYKNNPNMFVANKAWHDIDSSHPSRRFLEQRREAIYNNTQYISEIRHSFGISEEDIPAILLYKLNSNGHEDPVIIPINEDNLYDTIRGLVIATEPISNEIRKFQNHSISEQHSLIHNNSHEKKLCNQADLQILHQKLDNAVLQYVHNIKIIKSKGESNMINNIPHFKIGITFSGNYREKTVEPVAFALLEKGFTKKDIFYDFWHQPLLNGVNGDTTIRDIYRNRCDCIVVFLSPDYINRNWPGYIEWPAIKELINIGDGQKLCLLGINLDNIDKIDGLYHYQAIYKSIDNMSPAAIADFIYQKYLIITAK